MKQGKVIKIYIALSSLGAYETRIICSPIAKQGHVSYLRFALYHCIE